MKTALAALLFSCALIATAYAQTAAPASGTPSGNPAAATTSGSGIHHPGPCHEDVQKFCADVKKGGGAILACLKQHETELSPRCQAGMKRHESQPGTQAAPAPSTAAPPTK